MINLKKNIKLSAISLALLTSFNAFADQVILDDLIVDGSGCFGMDCVNGESFGFDTIRLKENNLRIRAVDTSSTSSFPSRDWQITFNDSSNGGMNKFSIDDIDSGLTPFTIEGAAPNHSLYVDDAGQIGLGTSTPVVELHIKDGNTPTLRLEQDGSNGFTAQTWDVAGNESNFFIRDATNGSKLPLRIVPGASNASLYIAADGDVGFETTTPDGQFDVAHVNNANNHAFLIDPNSNVGVNIDNSFVPNGLFDVQTTGGVSRFTVAADGNIGIGTTSPSSLLEIAGATKVETLNVAFSGLEGGEIGISDNTGTLKWWIDDHPNGLRIRQDGFGSQLVLDAGTENIGLGTDDPLFPVHHISGAHLTTGGVWTNASSRQLKNNIKNLDFLEAKEALLALTPVTYTYKSEPAELYAGFIAEDVPNLVATGDKKGLSSMDIVAVLTKILKEQVITIDKLNQRLTEVEKHK